MGYAAGSRRTVTSRTGLLTGRPARSRPSQSRFAEILVGIDQTASPRPHGISAHSTVAPPGSPVPGIILRLGHARERAAPPRENSARRIRVNWSRLQHQIHEHHRAELQPRRRSRHVLRRRRTREPDESGHWNRRPQMAAFDDLRGSSGLPVIADGAGSVEID